MGITAYRLAKDAKLPHQRGRDTQRAPGSNCRDRSPPLCLFWASPGYWLRVQLAYDLREAINTVGSKIKAAVHPLKAA